MVAGCGHMFVWFGGGMKGLVCMAWVGLKLGYLHVWGLSGLHIGVSTCMLHLCLY